MNDRNIDVLLEAPMPYDVAYFGDHPGSTAWGATSWSQAQKVARDGMFDWVKDEFGNAKKSGLHTIKFVYKGVTYAFRQASSSLLVTSSTGLEFSIGNCSRLMAMRLAVYLVKSGISTEPPSAAEQKAVATSQRNLVLKAIGA